MPMVTANAAGKNHAFCRRPSLLSVEIAAGNFDQMDQVRACVVQHDALAWIGGQGTEP